MIVGKGDIASILIDKEEAIFFASGVSNSLETRESEFQRELDLLSEQDKTKCIFYFSSIAIDNTEKFYVSKYLQHKKRMEDYIKDNFENYNIIRIGNITWGNNPNTFLNFIRNRIKNNEPVYISDEYKYMIDKDQFLLITNNLPITGKNQISIFGKMVKVKDLL
ncbi:hypothetical protein UFOVP449_171 [uncultured Caudovirales phage]|uniref:NAD(P)-binding domain containing protein n=1 Tax=uncultured Caudovirales phage TaxID=2100421 RepID=A0A6J5ME75_9CAUD|nr:hypothetical protein UFOVP449_171 [uncultured Caudovirales phage]